MKNGARIRQVYILDRMVENSFITPDQATTAKATPLVIKRMEVDQVVHAKHVGEMVRDMIFKQYGNDSYTLGLNVYTSITTKEQNAAYAAVRQGILSYDAKRSYRGPEYYAALPNEPDLLDEAIAEALSNTVDAGDMLAAVVLEAQPGKVVVRRSEYRLEKVTARRQRPALCFMGAIEPCARSTANSPWRSGAHSPHRAQRLGNTPTARGRKRARCSRPAYGRYQIADWRL